MASHLWVTRVVQALTSSVSVITDSATCTRGAGLCQVLLYANDLTIYCEVGGTTPSYRRRNGVSER